MCISMILCGVLITVMCKVDVRLDLMFSVNIILCYVFVLCSSPCSFVLFMFLCVLMCLLLCYKGELPIKEQMCCLNNASWSSFFLSNAIMLPFQHGKSIHFCSMNFSPF